MRYNPCVNNAQNISKFDAQNGVVNEVSIYELMQGQRHAARLVRRYGAMYWPIVERLQREIDAIEKRDALLAKLLDDDAKPANRASIG